MKRTKKTAETAHTSDARRKRTTALADTKQRGQSMPLNLTDIIGNLTITRNGQVTAWYVASPQRWSFLTHADCNGLVSSHAQRLSQLVGRRVHIRVTHRPYPVARWAADLHASVSDPLPGWPTYLAEEQQKVARLPLDDKVVYYGVSIGRLNNMGPAFQKVLRTSVDKQLRTLQRDIAAVDNIMSGPGMDAFPARATDMDWLMTRSLGLCLPAPLHTQPQPTDVWNASDLNEWTDGIEWASPAPYTPYVEVSGNRNGRRVTRLVAILTFGRMELPDIPESGSGPWLQRLDRLRFPYEVSAQVDVRDSTESANEISRQLDAVRHQWSHHREHNVQPPISLQRQAQTGQHIEDDIRHGAAGMSTRTKGWYRLAIAAPDQDTLNDRIQQVKELLEPHILVAHPHGQYHLAREFVPGEPLATDAYARRMPVRTLGGSLPAVTSDIGDRLGFNLGYTSGASRRPVMWHPWHSMEVREANGLTVLLGTQGSGKTALGGATVFHTAMMGVPWVVLDPSGPMRRLCELPELRPYSKAIDLMRAEPGTLNPFRLLPDPDEKHFTAEAYRDDDDPAAAARQAFDMEMRRTTRMRTTLATDILLMLLPKEIASSAQTHLVMQQAVDRVDASVHGSPREIINALHKLETSLHDHAQSIAGMLESAAETPQGQLIFPSAHGDDTYSTRHWRLLVFNLKGLALPSEDTNASDWSVEERLSMPMLHLAAWYTQSRIYDRDLGERKGLMMDEAHDFQRVSSGRELLRKTGRDSRKHNLRALISTQDGQDALTAGIDNWINSVFVGRTVGKDAQAAALKLLKIEGGNGYEEMLAGLSPHARGQQTRRGDREFIFSDGSGAVERITVPLRHRPALLNALDTTPRGHKQDDQADDRTTNPWARLNTEGAQR
ncbi:ATP-binding protein [Streptomyces sp. NPDC051644]|uniref:ATP-binding protein n=1 Tax=Streptomyces sp. NPDC051644 TaxID=3365666 RepID=UPI0037B3E6E5